MTVPDRVRVLLDRGVELPMPGTVEIGAEVDPERIAPGTVLHAGCRVHGASTSIGPGSVLGEEQPVVLKDCQLGHGVRLKGGFLDRATLLDGSSLGSGAQVRFGTLLEENVQGGHTVGLKQTILFPYVTAGSLINFCDILMSGGTGPGRHGEIGSSYVHFNFTPHGDKATASLLGDVPRGVMLDQPPIFLGGQGGLVGPARIAFGTLLPAGVVFRGDQEEPGCMVLPRPPPGPAVRPFTADVYGNIARVVAHGLAYIGNVYALQVWYAEARRISSGTDPYRMYCREGAQLRLGEVIDERIRRLGQLAEKMEASITRLTGQGRGARALQLQQAFQSSWPAIEEGLRRVPEAGLAAVERDVVLDGLAEGGVGSRWPERMRQLPPEGRQAGTRWLQAVVDSYIELWHPPSS